MQHLSVRVGHSDSATHRLRLTLIRQTHTCMRAAVASGVAHQGRRSRGRRNDGRGLSHYGSRPGFILLGDVDRDRAIRRGEVNLVTDDLEGGFTKAQALQDQLHTLRSRDLT